MDRLLREQQEHYRRLAPRYDEVTDDPALADDRLLAGLPIGGDVLELACGTGRWTGYLADRATRVTAVDGAAEMLSIARARTARPDVEFVEADLFAWAPPRRYDTVFFGLWLSHVPPAAFASFWTMVAAALRPGGAACFVDESDTARVHEPDIPDPRAPVAVRRVGDEKYHIVKIFYSPPELTGLLAGEGWSADIRRAGDRFYVGVATPSVQRNRCGAS